MPDLHVRQAAPNELERVIGLYAAVIEANRGTEFDVMWDFDLHPTIADLKKAIESGELYIAELDGFENFAGAVVLNHWYAPGYEKAPWAIEALDSELWIIHTFCTHPALAGQGIGRRFVAQICEIAREHGIKTLRLDVLPHNLPARKLYERCGFTDLGFFNLDYGEECYSDFHLMEKVL